ncbi:MAG: hypothetical protein EOR63_32085 [Mesorhizobium sp.]|nr:MAG: hypothetical protein EOR63_32085 [Mesorhizobium sp.]
MNASEAFAREAAGLLSILVREVGIIVSNGTTSRQPGNLRSGALIAAKGMLAGRMESGEVAEAIVAAARKHMDAVKAAPRIRSGDARLGRALASYCDGELKLAFRLFPDGLPAAAEWDSSTFRLGLADECLHAGYLLRHYEGGGLAWTTGIEAAEAPSPPTAEDDGLLAKSRLYSR